MRGRVAAVIVLIVLLVGIVVPAQANIAGSTLGAVSLGPVAYSVPFDITFTANFTSTGGLEKGEYMDYIDVTVPNQWTINAVYNTPHAVPANYTGCLGTTEGTLGQTIFWASTCTDVGGGAWPSGTHNFVANVTVTRGCLDPVLAHQDEWWGSPSLPHDVSAPTNQRCGLPDPARCPAATRCCPSRDGGWRTFVADAPIYWTPGELTSPLVTIKAGNRRACSA